MPQTAATSFGTEKKQVAWRRWRRAGGLGRNGQELKKGIMGKLGRTRT